MRRITLYGKPDCPLCDRAERWLRKFQRRFRFEIDVIDITQDPSLFERYCFDIPVIEVPGGPQLAGRLDERTLRGFLSEAFAPHQR